MRINIDKQNQLFLLVNDDNDTYLRQILNYKYWRFNEAISYMLGVSKVNWFESNDAENTIMTVSGNIVTESEAPDLINYIQYETERFHEIWSHSGLEEKLSPVDFIKWANETDLIPIWLEYAKEKNLLEQEEKPVTDKERDTFLVIIAALAKEAGIDINKTTKAGELIASLTQQMGCPVGATTVENKLKLIASAIQSRSK